MRKRNEYLVFIEDSEGEFTMIMTASEIFNRMDMDDCTGERIPAIYRLRPNTKRKLQKVYFYGAWHNWKSPLLMSIHDSKGRTLDYGYGTDH